MEHRVEFKSQTDEENAKFGCGAAALMMLLRHHKLPVRVPSYTQLCECLWLTVDPQIKGHSEGRGAYGSDVERALEGIISP